jgi:acyl carrier protein
MPDMPNSFDTWRREPNTPAEIVKSIIADELGIDEFHVIPSARLEADLGADDLDVVEIILALEDRFQLSVSDSDAINLTTVDRMIKHVEERLARRGRG